MRPIVDGPLRDEHGTGPVKRVFILITGDRVGGPLKGIFQYLRYLDPSRWEPLLGLFRMRGYDGYDAMVAAQAAGLPYVLLEQRRRFDWGLVVQARRIAAEREVAIVQTHNYKPHILGAILKHQLRVPWVAFSHGATAENWRVRLYHHTDRWVLRRADRVIAVSSRMATELQRGGIPAEKVVTVRNAVDLPPNASGGRTGEFRRAHGVPDDAPLVVVIGRLSREKGQHVFLDAFRQLLRSVPRAHAALVGEGLDADVLRARASALGLDGRVHFVEYQRRLETVYGDADAVSIPSLSEGIPNVLLEAMSAGCPVVGTVVGGIPEVVTHGREALLVPPGDAEALANALGAVLRDRDLRRHLTGHARSRLHEAFDPGRRAQQIARVYESLAGSCSRSQV